MDGPSGKKLQLLGKRLVFPPSAVSGAAFGRCLDRQGQEQLSGTGPVLTQALAHLSRPASYTQGQTAQVPYPNKARAPLFLRVLRGQLGPACEHICP